MFIRYIAISITICCILASDFAIAKTSLSSQQIATKSMPSIVTIRTYDLNNSELSMGTGFVVGAGGIILTNYHVIKDANSIIVTDNKGVNYTNTLILNFDIERDLAVLKVKSVKLPHLTISDSTKARQGDKVYAIGNPMGYERTFSDGIISSFRTLDNVKVIQFTAPISSGSSGGPLLNDAGKVIGINTMTHTKGQNINIAISSQEFNKIIVSLPHKETSEELFHRSNTGKPVLENDIDATISDRTVWNKFNWDNIIDSSIYYIINIDSSNTDCSDKANNNITELINKSPTSSDLPDSLPVSESCMYSHLFDVDTSVGIKSMINSNEIEVNLYNNIIDKNKVISWANNNFGKAIIKNATSILDGKKYLDGNTHYYYVGNTAIAIQLFNNSARINYSKKTEDNVVKHDLYLTCSLTAVSRDLPDKYLNLLLDQQNGWVRTHEGVILFAKAVYASNTITVTYYEDAKHEKVSFEIVINRVTGKLNGKMNNSSINIKGDCVQKNDLKVMF